MFGGHDTAANLRCLCHRCHRAITKTEMRVWRIRTARERGVHLSGTSAVTAAVRLARQLPPVPTAGAFIFALGVIDGRWAMLAAITLGVLLIVGPLFRFYLMPGPWRSGRRGGIDGLDYFARRDADREERMSGILGAAARGYYGTRIKLITVRLALVMGSGLYLAGAIVRAWLIP